MVLSRFWSLGQREAPGKHFLNFVWVSFFTLGAYYFGQTFGPLNNGLLPLTKWEHMKIKKGFKKK
jgi:hypothetical protein